MTTTRIVPATGASAVRRGPWLGGLLTMAACLAVLSILSLVRSPVAMTYLNLRYADEVNIVSTAGMVHQMAGAALFVSLPLAGLALAGRLSHHEHWTRTATVVRRLGTAAIGIPLTLSVPLLRVCVVAPR